MARLWTALTVLLIGLAALALRAGVPPLIYVDGGYDDQHFASVAASLTRGGWMGPYDPNVTLSKGIGYPAFLAASHVLHLPFLLAQQILHCTATGVMALLVARLSGRRLLGILSFGVLALDPAYFGTFSSRPIRDNWYASVSLLLVALLGLLLLRGTGPIAGKRAYIRGIGLGVVTGFVAAAYWLGREERPWLLPAALVLVAWSCIRCLRDRPAGTPTRVWLLPTVGAGLALIVTASAFVVGVALTNEQRYGVFLTNDLTEGAFAKAFGQWQAVRSGPVAPYVPISHGMREAAFQVSPAARELQPYLGPASERGWIRPGCDVMHVCNDVAGGWTQWMLRSALAETGRYNDAAQAQRFWNRLSQELKRACDSGRLSCRSATPMLLPQPDTISGRRYLRSFEEGASWVLNFHMSDQDPQRSVGAESNWGIFRHALRGLPPTLAEEQRLESARHWGPRVTKWLAEAYHILIIPALLVGTFPYVRWSKIGKSHRAVAVLGITCGIAALCRIAFLALVDSTAFPASRSVYLLPASNFLLLYCLIGTWLLVTRLCKSRPLGV